MKKIQACIRSIIAVGIIILSIMYFTTGTEYKGVLPLLIAILMGIIAFNSWQKLRKDKINKIKTLFWVSSFACIINLINVIIYFLK